MTITDEQLSAFLDAELPAHEMELIRQQLCNDENLANRLAELAMVDEQLASHYAQIDERSMPDAITHLLAGAPANSSAQNDSSTNNVIAFPLWKKAQRALQQHAAMAASVALVIGFGAAQLLPGNQGNDASNWNAVAQALDNTISGTETTLANGSRIKPRLSFVNQDGNICRQFQIVEQHQRADSIACKRDNRWQLSVSVYSQDTLQQGDYQTASGNAVLDSALDDMMQSDAFDADAEAQAIQNQWRAH